MDKLDNIFQFQYKLQEKLGTIEKFRSSKSMKQQYINQMILAIHEEAVEIMRESAYKNPEYVPFGWKINQEFNIEKFKDEIVDLLHFVINLCIVSEMDTSELYAKYITKHKENVKRKQIGY